MRKYWHDNLSAFRACLHSIMRGYITVSFGTVERYELRQNGREKGY